MLIKKLIFLFYVSTNVYDESWKAKKQIACLMLSEHILEYLTEIAQFVFHTKRLVLGNFPAP